MGSRLDRDAFQTARAMEFDERFNQAGVTPAAVCFFDQHFVGGDGWQCVAIRPTGGERIEDIDDADDLREHWDVVSGKAVGIAAPVEAFVMMTDDRPNTFERTNRRAQLVANYRMTLH